METLEGIPFAVLTISFLTMWAAARAGLLVRTKRLELAESVHGDLDRIIAATLTLLGLIIGFTFSMAIERYDQRKNYEEAEANAIGTEYLRADFLAPANMAQVRGLLKQYLDQRILFYEIRQDDALGKVNATTSQLQTQLWSAVHEPGPPTSLAALAALGMNDVLNSQGYTQAAWWNRIPPGAWVLMAMVAICANLLMGFDERSVGPRTGRFAILPFILCIAFYSISDIDSPRHGLIRVKPQNLISLAQSLRT